jgi:outer membrane protein OmpA-like peptidoglycan-associated protein
LAGICTWAFQTFSGLVRPEVAEVAPPVFPLGVSPPGLSQPETDVALPEFDPGADASVAALMISPEAQALQAELEAAAALRAAAVMVEELEAASEAERLADAETNRMLAEQEAAAIADAEEAQLEALRLADLASQDVEQAERVAESQAAAALAARITATEEAAAARRLRASARQAETARRDTPAPTIQPEVTTEPSATIGTPVVTTRTTTTAPAPTGENMSAGSSSDTYGLRTPISAIPDTLPAPSSVQSPGPNSYSAQFPAAFTYNNNAMSVSNEAQAMAIINAIIASPGPVRVVGHTDSSGSATMNLRLGWLRANTVRKYLIRSGVEDSRITVESAGPSQPITTNETREGRELNRRVMLIYPRAQR